MAKCLRVCPVYKIKYSGVIVPGWDNIEKFMAWLYEKARQGNIPSLHNDEGNEKILQKCLNEADPDNAEIHISIW